MELYIEAWYSMTGILVVKQVPLNVKIGVSLKRNSQQVGSTAFKTFLGTTDRYCIRWISQYRMKSSQLYEGREYSVRGVIIKDLMMLSEQTMITLQSIG